MSACSPIGANVAPLQWLSALTVSDETQMCSLKPAGEEPVGR